MPVVGASAVVESCLMADRRRESKHETLQDYFEENDTLAPLIRKAELSRIPISELLDEDEDLDSIIKGKPTRFGKLRNKFAHGDTLEIMTWHKGSTLSYHPKMN